jgi:isopentenyl diphosphate isomerase/L-lactate dehydrogenase-like FMN-dependent dehydrogenase
LIRRELDLTMVLCGVRTIAEIDQHVLHDPPTLTRAPPGSR